jgi:outer membrane protein TolC
MISQFLFRRYDSTPFSYASDTWKPDEMTRKFFLYIQVFLLILEYLFHPPYAQSAAMEEPASIVPERITDFKTCALANLKRTPQLQRTKIELDIRRLDEDDARWSYLPVLELTSSYYFSKDGATISFDTGNYRPWEPYYNLQAQKIISEIVMLKHIQAITQSLYELADTFLQLASLSQADIDYQEIDALLKKKLNYIENRQTTGVTAPIEVEVERQTLAFFNAKHAENLAKRETLLSGLCVALNLPDPKIFDIDNSLALEQIFGPSGVSALENLPMPVDSIDQQIVSKKQTLQEKKILLAYSRYMPDFSIGVRSPDIINTNTDTEKDYFFYVGMRLTLWDGSKRARDITRQEMLLRQMQYEKKETENNSALEWLQAKMQYNLAKAEYSMSQSSENIKIFNLKKRESEYKAGIIKFPDLVNQQIEMHTGRVDLIQKELAYNKAGLKLRYLSGQLLKDTINISFVVAPNE